MAEQDNSVGAVVFAVVWNGCLMVVLLGLFEVLIRRPQWHARLAPLNSRGGGDNVDSNSSDRQVASLCTWILRGRAEAIDHLPMDFAVLIQFMDMGLRFSIFGCVMAVVLIPLYATGSGTAEGFNQFSLQNLESHDRVRFSVVIVAGYMMMAMLAWLSVTQWHSFVALRRKHYRRAASGELGPDAAQAMRSVLVEEIPKAARSEASVTKFFQVLFGDDIVHSCRLQEPPSKGQSSRSTSAVGEAEMTDSSMQQGEGATHDPMVGSGAARQVMTGVVRELGTGVVQGARGAVAGIQEATLGKSRATTALVTLSRAATALQAQQVAVSDDLCWKIQQAPEPRDIIWNNIGNQLSQVQLRQSIVRALCIVGVLFWSVPVTLIQGWASIESLQKWFPGVEKLQEWSPTLYTFITSYLPVVALLVLQLLLPIIFTALARRYEGVKAKSEVQRSVLSRVFSYRLASLYVTVIAGSIWDALSEIVDKPSDLFTLLSQSLPKVAVYFITYVFTSAATGLPMLLLRPTQRGNGPVTCQLGSESATAATVLVISLTYSLTAPAIFFPCAVYFGVARLVYRWLALYVYEPEFDGRGAIWYDLFNSVIVGLLLGMLAMVALLMAYTDVAQGVFLIPLPFFVLYLAWYCWQQLGACSRFVPLEDALRADSAVQTNEREVLPPMRTDFYENPEEAPSDIPVAAGSAQPHTQCEADTVEAGAANTAAAAQDKSPGEPASGSGSQQKA